MYECTDCSDDIMKINCNCVAQTFHSCENGELMKITKELLERIVGISKEAYPREIAGLLLVEKGKINDFVILPGNYETKHVYVKMHLMPIYPNSIGTFHSHPSRSFNPSRADLNFFSSSGRIHLIVSYPYDFNSIGAYDSNGNKVDLEVVE